MTDKIIKRAESVVDELNATSHFTQADIVLDLMKYTERLRAELDKQKPQPIETAPKDGTRILVKKGVTISSAQWDYKNGQLKKSKSWKGAPFSNPTHWMPIPKGPDDE